MTTEKRQPQLALPCDHQPESETMKIDFHTDDRDGTTWLATHASNGAILATGKTEEACKANLRRSIQEQIGFGPSYDSAPDLHAMLGRMLRITADPDPLHPSWSKTREDAAALYHRIK